MTLPVGGIFYLDYTYGDKKRYTKEEWTKLYLDGEKACFDWEKDGDEWVMKLPDGTVVCAVGKESRDNEPRMSCCFYPTCEWNFTEGDDPKELLELGKKQALEYGFKILDLKLRVMV